MSNSIKRFDEENKKRPAVVGRFRYILYLLHFLQQSHSVCHRFFNGVCVRGIPGCDLQILVGGKPHDDLFRTAETGAVDIYRDQVIQQYTYGASVSVSEWGNKALSSKDLKIPKLEKGVFSSPTAMG